MKELTVDELWDIYRKFHEEFALDIQREDPTTIDTFIKEALISDVPPEAQ